MTWTVDRRDVFKALAGSAGLMAGLSSLGEAKEVAEAKEKVRRGSAPVRITDVRTILTQPGDWLVIVKVETSEPGLYGVGCATHGERPLAVRAVVDEYLKPLLVGKSVEDIEDIWQTQYVTSYFRSGVTLNNALSGVDGALWDILGKRAGMPLYKLLGGKVRAAATLYTHASARTLPELEDQVRKYMAQGYRHIRVQLAVPGFSGYGVSNPTSDQVQKMRPEGVAPSPVFEPTPYVNNTIKMFEYLRSKLGFEVELLHDVHERIPPVQAIALAKALEPLPAFLSGRCASRRRTCSGSSTSARSARRPWRWANCSSTGTNGCLWWPIAGSTSSAAISPRSAG